MVARAIGVWTGTLEKAMVLNDPTVEMVDLLAKLTDPMQANGWLHGIAPLTVQEIWKWVADWDVEEPDNRTTVTESTWDEPEPLKGYDPEPGDDRIAWLRRNPVFTLEYWKKTWGTSKSVSPEDILRSYRWYPMQEFQHGVVWRWNPLKLPRPTGKPVSNYLRSPASSAAGDVSMRPALLHMKKSRVQAILDAATAAGFQQATTQEVAQVFYGRTVKNTKTLQSLRNEMAACGWEYNMYDKVWRPKKP
jgi:hypothetical protein